MMDVNYLLHRQQMSLMCAERASCEESRAAHEGLAQGYRSQLLDYRRANAEALGQVRWSAKR